SGPLLRLQILSAGLGSGAGEVAARPAAKPKSVGDAPRRESASERVRPAALRSRIDVAAVLPDRRRIGVRLGLRRQRGIVYDQFGRNVALLGDVNAPQVADALLVLGGLTDADIEPVVVNAGRGDKVVARALRP